MLTEYEVLTADGQLISYEARDELYIFIVGHIVRSTDTEYSQLCYLKMQIVIVGKCTEYRSYL